MQAKLLMTALVFILMLNCVSALYEERDIFIIDSDGDTQYKYQLVGSVEYGYYIEAQDLVLLVPENSTNLQFYDSYGKISATYEYTEEGYKVYTVTTREIEYDEPYEIGFTHDLPKYTTTRYKENYFFEYPYYKEIGSEKETYVCIPNSASEYAEYYDSTPEDDWRVRPIDYYNFTLPEIAKLPEIKPITPLYGYDYNYKSEYSQIQEVEVCPSGYSDEWILGIDEGIITAVEFDFKMPSAKISNSVYNGDKITVEYPAIYKSIIEKNTPLLEKTLNSIEQKLNLDSPSSYKLIFVSDNDKVLSGDNAMISYEDGTVYFQTGLMRLDNDQLLQINLLRGIINSAMLNTYGTSTDDSWWTNGALTSLALIIMKDNDLEINEIQTLLNDFKDAFDELTTNEIIEIMQDSEMEYRITIDSGIVDEIDNLCPNHAIKLNKITKDMDSLDFSNDKEFNNYILYNLREECSKDISEVLDKYKLEHDNVQVAVDKFNRIKQKFSEIKIDRTDIEELNTIRNNINQVEGLLKVGKVEQATELIDEADNLYETKLKNLLEILKEFNTAEDEVKSIPLVFSLPSKMMASSNLDSAMTFIKEEDFDSARSKINSAKFWSNNALTISIIIYVLIGVGIFFGYKKYQNNKRVVEKIKPHHTQHKKHE